MGCVVSAHMTGEKVEWVWQWIKDKNTEAKRMSQEQLCHMPGTGHTVLGQSPLPPTGSVSHFLALSS